MIGQREGVRTMKIGIAGSEQHALERKRQCKGTHQDVEEVLRLVSSQIEHFDGLRDDKAKRGSETKGKAKCTNSKIKPSNVAITQPISSHDNPTHPLMEEPQ